jgi:hypothetical protein
MTVALEGGEWSAARPGRTLPPEKNLYPLYRRLGGPQGRSGRAENLVPHRDSIPDRPARSQSLYRLSYRAHIYELKKKVNQSNYSPKVPRGFQEVKFPRFRDNGTGWW